MGLLNKIETQLKQSGCAVSIFLGVRPNPTIEQVESGVKQAIDTNTNVIVAVGGGSVCDFARAVSLGVTHSGDIWEYRVTGNKGVAGIRDVLLPLVTIPTIAGTGSEVSPAFLISKGTSKQVFFSPYLFPKAAIIDPSLALHAPIGLSLEIGFDAFVQGFEAFVSRTATPLSDTFALRGMQLAAENLKLLLDKGDNIAARTNMALAALLSLFGVNQAGVGGVHALSDPLSGHYNVWHGLALAAVIGAVVNFNIDANYTKYAQIAEVLGASIDRLTISEAAQQAVVKVQKFTEELGLFHTLRDFGMNESNIIPFAQEAQNPDLASNPKTMSEQDIVKIYEYLL